MYYRGGSYAPGAFDINKLDKSYFRGCLCYAEVMTASTGGGPTSAGGVRGLDQEQHPLGAGGRQHGCGTCPRRSRGHLVRRMAINCSVFKDTNPDCLPDARYKMLGGYGSCAFKSADGIHFTAMSPEVVIPITLAEPVRFADHGLLDSVSSGI